MNKNLLGFGAVLLLFFAIAATLVGYSVWKGGSDDRTSLAWVETHIPPLLSHWSSAQLKQDASASYLRELEFRGQLDADFKRFSQLGELQQLGAFEGQSDVSFPKRDSHKNPIFTASYSAPARFTKGKANIDVTLQQENGVWKLQSFKITPQDN